MVFDAINKLWHRAPYSLFYGFAGYDNERGKGDHRHYRDCEERLDNFSRLSKV